MTTLRRELDRIQDPETDGPCSSLVQEAIRWRALANVLMILVQTQRPPLDLEMEFEPFD